VLVGVSNRGGGLLDHRVIFTVTDCTKEINGVRTVAVWDRDYNADRLQEEELAFFAQDKDGSVWTLGEYPEEYENGEFIGAPSTWIAGLGGAEAGMHNPGNPKVGEIFLQGWVNDISFLDCGSVYSLGGSTCVPYNCYTNVMVIDEWSPLEPGTGHQRKYYAPTVGIVRVGAVDDPEGETLVLANIVHLDAQGLVEARNEVLRMESRAYQISDIYRRTPPVR
jgi:hypothetical protein